MEVQAFAKSVRVSPRKVRLIADAIRSKEIDEAFRILFLSDKRAAVPLMKTLRSAVANAVNNAKLEQKNLKIKQILVDEGQVMKRFRPSTRGRVHPYKKRGTHIRVVLEEKPMVAASAKPIPAKKAEEKKGK
jgi:large subunit ribosomal protein L22